MGALSLPTSGTVYLDTDTIIYSVEKIEPYWSLLEPLWRTAQGGVFGIVSSELALLETLVKPLQLGDTTLEQTYRTLLTATREVKLVPIDSAVIETASRLRASLGLKAPDAIHAASALNTGCSLFLSNDAVFGRVPGLAFVRLGNFITP